MNAKFPREANKFLRFPSRSNIFTVFSATHGNFAAGTRLHCTAAGCHELLVRRSTCSAATPLVLSRSVAVFVDVLPARRSSKTDRNSIRRRRCCCCCRLFIYSFQFGFFAFALVRVCRRCNDVSSVKKTSNGITRVPKVERELNVYYLCSLTRDRIYNFRYYLDCR